MIENQTDLLIIQDRRERFHPFNTARMVHASLEKCQLIADRIPQLSNQNFSFGSTTGLLYPGKGSTPLSLVPCDELPRQLVVIDGTWHQAKQIMKYVPALHSLPQFSIQPENPSNYRIRKEPTLQSLSTLEAIVYALRTLEPNLKNTAQLLSAFDAMIDAQIAHPKSPTGKRENKRRYGTPFNIPVKLIREPENIVVAYGESQRIYNSSTNEVVKYPLYWVAERLTTGETFSAIIDNGKPVSDINLQHLELERCDFEMAVSHREFRDAWFDFLGPDDSIATYKLNTAFLLQSVNAFEANNLVLKSVDLERGRNSSIERMILREQVDVQTQQLPGRGGRRLAQTVSLAKYLHDLGNK